MIEVKGPAHPLVESKIVVGLSGYARSGKDTVANVLVEHYGFKRFAFADKLRECVYALNPIVRGEEPRPIEEWEGLSDEIPYRIRFSRVKEVIDEYGWDGYKETIYGPEIRELLQRMGTEVGRDIIGEDTWVKGLDSETGRIVVTDMRFPNEYDRVVANKGQPWRIERPGVGAVNRHISETALDEGFDFWNTIHNDGTLEELEVKVHNLALKNKW